MKKKYLLIILFCLLTTLCVGEVLPQEHNKAKTLLKSGIGTVAIQYEGILCSVDSFAKSEMFYITGRKSYNHLPATYVVLASLYQPERWKKEKLIPIKFKSLKQRLHIPPEQKRLSVEEILSPEVSQQISEIIHTSEDARLKESAYELYNRAMRFLNLRDSFCIIPPLEAGERKWMSPFELGPEPSGYSPEILGLHKALKSFFEGNADSEKLKNAIKTFITEVSELQPAYPPEWKRRLDSFYARVNLFLLAMLMFLLALLFWFLYFVRRPRTLYITAIAFTILGLVFHLSAFIIRLLVAGFAPLSNMYESLIFFTGSIVLIALVVESYHRRGLVASAAALLGFIVLVILSIMPPSVTRVVPLRAVLNSAWLTYHVVSCLLAYAAFTLAFVFSLIYLLKDFTNDRLLRWLADRSVFDELNYRFIQFGWPLLGIGILTGAIWADTAWGKAWSWDPKETWSLITWLIYAGFLHLRIIKGKKGRITAIASVVGFLAVLITWFGVSYLGVFGGGLHTYA